MLIIVTTNLCIALLALDVSGQFAIKKKSLNKYLWSDIKTLKQLLKNNIDAFWDVVLHFYKMGVTNVILYNGKKLYSFIILNEHAYQTNPKWQLRHNMGI